MASPVKFLSLLFAFALFAVGFALFEEPRELQELDPQIGEEEAREFAALFSNGVNSFGRFVNWTTCNASQTSLVSCIDCQTRLLCLPNDIGIASSCPNDIYQHCNRGVCSNIKSPNC